jgi:hypothetical protein
MREKSQWLLFMEKSSQWLLLLGDKFLCVALALGRKVTSGSILRKEAHSGSYFEKKSS